MTNSIGGFHNYVVAFQEVLKLLNVRPAGEHPHVVPLVNKGYNCAMFDVIVDNSDDGNGKFDYFDDIM